MMNTKDPHDLTKPDWSKTETEWSVLSPLFVLSSFGRFLAFVRKTVSCHLFSTFFQVPIRELRRSFARSLEVRDVGFKTLSQNSSSSQFSVSFRSVGIRYFPAIIKS